LAFNTISLGTKFPQERRTAFELTPFLARSLRFELSTHLTAL
jgi:hypothetical protein